MIMMVMTIMHFEMIYLKVSLINSEDSFYNIFFSDCNYDYYDYMIIVVKVSTIAARKFIAREINFTRQWTTSSRRCKNRNSAREVEDCSVSLHHGWSLSILGQSTWSVRRKPLFAYFFLFVIDRITITIIYIEICRKNQICRVTARSGYWTRF